ncbi:hypothetical protein L1987_59409 [Smallanthus sonchifolius]|uniref:Uncharacterized protein n=1 Tax=Smallanthus sonchifolius TaxID=185202 RepID=A0ACB9D5D4_9ASTR|nr:hypothetical protein L1987_59409 [Smallanthus sonchifolius]
MVPSFFKVLRDPSQKKMGQFSYLQMKGNLAKGSANCVEAKLGKCLGSFEVGKWWGVQMTSLGKLNFLNPLMFKKNPSELYGKHTWKIDKFALLKKRELRTNAFEVHLDLP